MMQHQEISAPTREHHSYLNMPFEISLSEVSTTAQVAFAAEKIYETSLNFVLSTGSAILDCVLTKFRARGPHPGDIC